MSSKRRMPPRSARSSVRTLSARSRTLPIQLKPIDYIKQADFDDHLCVSPEPSSPSSKRHNTSLFDDDICSPFPSSQTSLNTSSSLTPVQQPPSKPLKAALQQLLNANIEYSVNSLVKRKRALSKIDADDSGDGSIKAKISNTSGRSGDQLTPLKEAGLAAGAPRQVRRSIRYFGAKSKSVLSYTPSPCEDSGYSCFLANASSLLGTSCCHGLSSASSSSDLNVTPDHGAFGKLYSRQHSCNKKLLEREDAFYKSLQPRRLLEWSDNKNLFLTLQNYMSSLKVRKHKIKLDQHMLLRHPELDARMRWVLFDWMMEVCDSFGLQRATFYLAQYYVDAYLTKTGVRSTQTTPLVSPATSSMISMCSPQLPTVPAVPTFNTSAHNGKESFNTSTPDLGDFGHAADFENLAVPKTHLQLLGITALFVAAKMEEINPPRLTRFSYITDGACTNDDITRQEVVLLQALNWVLCPVTVYDWLRIYLQTTYYYLIKAKPTARTRSGKAMQAQIPTSLSKMEVSRGYCEDVSFNPIVFAQMCQLLDLATLDVESLQFQPYELAASILYHFSSQNTAKKASNLNMSKLVDCVSWLTPMALSLKDAGLVKEPNRHANVPDNPRNYRDAPQCQWYNVQYHDQNTVELLENVLEKRKTQAAKSPAKELENRVNTRSRTSNSQSSSVSPSSSGTLSPN